MSVPPSQVFPIPTDGPDAATAAAAYARTLATAFGIPPDGTPPRFDLILLGLGDDGHTLSLFPGKPALDVTDRLVVATPPGRLPPPVDRLTLTLPVVNAATRVVFLLAGAGKAATLRQVLRPDGGDPSTSSGQALLPAARVRPTDGTLLWLTDQAAAAEVAR